MKVMSETLPWDYDVDVFVLCGTSINMLWESGCVTDMHLEGNLYGADMYQLSAIELSLLWK